MAATRGRSSPFSDRFDLALYERNTRLLTGLAIQSSQAFSAAVKKLAKCISRMPTSESPDQEPRPEDRYLKKMRGIIRSHTHQERMSGDQADFGGLLAHQIFHQYDGQVREGAGNRRDARLQPGMAAVLYLFELR